jgi:hypothetical protein
VLLLNVSCCWVRVLHQGTLCSGCSPRACRAAVEPAGNVNTQPTQWFADMLWAGKDCYLGEASVHY